MANIKWYVVTETLKVFLTALVVTLALMTLGGGAKEGIKQGLPPHLVVRTMPFLIPEMLRFTVPGCLLFAVCSVFSRMSGSNEIVAIKSLGISPMRVVWPVLVLAYLLSIMTFALYDVCATWSRPGMRSLVTNSIDEIALGFLKSAGSFDAHGLSIIVKGVEEDRLLQPVISVQSRGQTPAVTLVAQEACLRNDRRAGMLHIECVRGQIDVAGKGSFKFPDRFSHRMQLQEPEVDPENHLSPANLAGRQITPQIARERKLIAELQSRLENEPESDERSAWERERDRRAARLHRLSAEVPRRMSNGFGCFCFALVGIPVAMRNRSSDVMSVFFLCFLPVLLVYYPLLVVGENMARDGTLPYVSVWMADAVLVVAGILLLRRSMRN